MKLITKTCDRCLKPFKYSEYQKNRRFCSIECSAIKQWADYSKKRNYRSKNKNHELKVKIYWEHQFGSPKITLSKKYGLTFAKVVEMIDDFHQEMFTPIIATKNR